MYFLKKNEGLMWFMMMKSFGDTGVEFMNKLAIDPVTGKENEPAFAAMDIYVFDGMGVYRHQHDFKISSLITQDRSRSWLFENPIRNLRGWEPGWRNSSDFDEIHPTRADNVTLCYLPKNLDLLKKDQIRMFSLTFNLKLAKFGIKFRGKKEDAKKETT